MTLSDRVASVIETLALLDTQKSSEGKAATYERRADQFSEPANELSSLLGPFKILRDTSIDVEELKSQNLAFWQSTIEALQKQYREQPESILNPISDGDPRYKLFDPLKKLPERIASIMLQAWEEWVARRTSSINSDVLDLFANVPSYSSEVARIRQLQVQVRNMSMGLPTSDQTPRQVSALSEQIDAAWQKLTAHGLPDEVLVFLRAAGGKDGATYYMLTNEVMSWLEKHELLRTLRIRLS